MKKIKIIIVDDHRLFRMGLKAIISAGHPDILVAGEAGCGKELFEILPTTPADMVLLDINLPDMSGVEIASCLRYHYPNIKILAVSAEDAIETIQSMVEAGIDGFVSKQKGDPDELINAIRTVAEGLDYYGRDVAPFIYGVYVSKKKTTDITAEFTDREREVIIACREGLLCKEIADRMGISINTINTYKKRIFQKLGINTTVEIVQYATKKGIVRMEG